MTALFVYTRSTKGRPEPEKWCEPLQRDGKPHPFLQKHPINDGQALMSLHYLSQLFPYREKESVE